MESCPTQAVRPLAGLATDKVIRDRYTTAIWVYVEQSACPLPHRLTLRNDGNLRAGLWLI
ncbi:MAG: hypothetical protein ACQESR_15045 [Planctomycetota bacterium]